MKPLNKIEDRIIKNYWSRIQTRARTLVQQATKKGTIEKKDCYCGEVKTFAHHDNYLDPLNVIWLCRKHHVERHNGKK